MKLYVCVYSLELPHQGDSYEYTQQIIKKISLNYHY